MERVYLPVVLELPLWSQGAFCIALSPFLGEALRWCRDPPTASPDGVRSWPALPPVEPPCKTSTCYSVVSCRLWSTSPITLLPVWRCFSPPCDPGELSFNSLLVPIVPPPGSLLGPFPLTQCHLSTPWELWPAFYARAFHTVFIMFSFTPLPPWPTDSSLDVGTVSHSSLPSQQSSAEPGHIGYSSSTTEVNYAPSCLLPTFYHDSFATSPPAALHPPAHFLFQSQQILIIILCMRMRLRACKSCLI